MRNSSDLIWDARLRRESSPATWVASPAAFSGESAGAPAVHLYCRQHDPWCGVYECNGAAHEYVTACWVLGAGCWVLGARVQSAECRVPEWHLRCRRTSGVMSRSGNAREGGGGKGARCDWLRRAVPAGELRMRTGHATLYA